MNRLKPAFLNGPRLIFSIGAIRTLSIRAPVALYLAEISRFSNTVGEPFGRKTYSDFLNNLILTKKVDIDTK